MLHARSRLVYRSTDTFPERERRKPPLLLALEWGAAYGTLTPARSTPRFLPCASERQTAGKRYEQQHQR